ncbi:hypothetical protein BY458DRAFT_494723 [Sporodiniella umbellata]|nr:hypothetical protein BY458DRAFT_494723 [Sporodiniella umbellata]
MKRKSSFNLNVYPPSPPILPPLRSILNCPILEPQWFVLPPPLNTALPLKSPDSKQLIDFLPLCSHWNSIKSTANLSETIVNKSPLHSSLNKAVRKRGKKLKTKTKIEHFQNLNSSHTNRKRLWSFYNFLEACFYLCHEPYKWNLKVLADLNLFGTDRFNLLCTIYFQVYPKTLVPVLIVEEKKIPRLMMKIFSNTYFLMKWPETEPSNSWPLNLEP